MTSRSTIRTNWPMKTLRADGFARGISPTQLCCAVVFIPRDTCTGPTNSRTASPGRAHCCRCRHEQLRTRIILLSKNFSELGLSEKVLAAIEASGYTIPTPIQSAAIPIAIAGRDVLGIAQTGTGKTASFVLPMITRLERGRARARMPRSLILAPTRELAAQVADSFERYGVNHKLTLALLIGGVSFDDQLKKLDRGVDVLIATPGRMLDHYNRGKLLLTGVEILVIDEADRMLDMGFIPDIERICSLLPPKRQTLFFSATMPPEITRLVQRFLNDPERIEVAPPATTAGTIEQRFQYVSSDPREKREALRQLIRSQTGQERDHLLQSQEGRRRPLQVAEKARLQCRMPAR